MVKRERSVRTTKLERKKGGKHTTKLEQVTHCPFSNNEAYINC